MDQATRKIVKHMRVFSIIGLSKSGKTTTAVNIIRELKNRGFSVSSIKNIHFDDFTMEKENSNTWKHWRATDNVVFARGKRETYQIWHRKLDLNEILEHLNTDWVVIEGMKREAVPKILCAYEHEQLDRLYDKTVFVASGVISNNLKSYRDINVYNSNDDIINLVDLIEEKVFHVLPLSDPECCTECGFSCYEMCGRIISGQNSRHDCKIEKETLIKLSVNNRDIKMVPFVQKILHDTIKSFVSNLKGTGKGTIKITIE